MDISLTELKEKEIINIFDGRKLGRIIDILFDVENGMVRGIVVPGEKKVFKRSEDIFIPLEQLKKIGDDVVIVKIPVQNNRGDFAKNSRQFETAKQNYYKNQNYLNHNSFQSEMNDGVINGFGRRQNIENNFKSQGQSNKFSYVRFKPINNKKYK